jgi:hypothetical protein
MPSRTPPPARPRAHRRAFREGEVQLSCSFGHGARTRCVQGDRGDSC